MTKPKNLLYSFALRMLLVLLANAILWTLGVQLYYQHKTTSQTLDIVQSELSALEPHIREVAYHQRAQLPTFLKETMQQHEIPFLQIYKKGEGLLFSHGDSALPPQYRPLPTEFPANDSPDYRLFQHNNTYYLYLFTTVFEPGWYMRAAIPVRAELINRIDDTRNTAMVVVVVTLLQVLFFIYPLMLAAYNRTLKDRASLIMSNLWTILALGNAISKRDSDTDIHNYRVSFYALRLAEETGLEPTKIPGLIKGAFLHDVGKIGVPDSVLLKPGRLNSEEFDIIQKHVSDGLEIIAGIPWLRDAAPVIAGHHEHYNGEGYPKNLKGEEIPVEARIFSVVDVFDALTSSRPYKQAHTIETALQIMDKVNGEHFDPEIYRTFRKLAPSLRKKVLTDDRHKLRRILSHAILPYFPLIFRTDGRNIDENH